PQVRDIRRLGACSVDLCLAAAGDLDVCYENGLNPWDFAAGAPAAEEAGVRFGAADGGPAHHRLLIAAMPRVWEELRDAIVAAGGESPCDTPTVLLAEPLPVGQNACATREQNDPHGHLPHTYEVKEIRRMATDYDAP